MEANHETTTTNDEQTATMLWKELHAEKQELERLLQSQKEKYDKKQREWQELLQNKELEYEDAMEDMETTNEALISLSIESEEQRQSQEEELRKSKLLLLPTIESSPNERLRRSNVTIQKLQEELDYSRNRTSELEEEVTPLQQQQETLKANLSALQEEQVVWEQQLEERNKAFDLLLQQQQQQPKNSSMENEAFELEQSKRRVIELETQINALHEEAKKLEQNHQQALETSNSSLQKELVVEKSNTKLIQTLLASAQQNAKTATKERDSLQLQVKDLNEKLAEETKRFETEMTAWQTILGALEDEQAAWETKATEEKRAYEKMKTTSQAKQDELVKVREELEQAKARNVQLDKIFEKEQRKTKALEQTIDTLQLEHDKDMEMYKEELQNEMEEKIIITEEADHLKSQLVLLTTTQSEVKEMQIVKHELEEKNRIILELESTIEASNAELDTLAQTHQWELNEQRIITKNALQEVEQVCALGEQVESAIHAHNVVKEKDLALQELQTELLESEIELKTKTEIYQRELAAQAVEREIAAEDAANYKRELAEIKGALEESLTTTHRVTDASAKTIDALRESSNVSNQELSSLHALLATQSQRLKDAERELADLKKGQNQRRAVDDDSSKHGFLDSILTEIINGNFEKVAAAVDDSETSAEQEEKVKILLRALDTTQDEIEELKRLVESSDIFERNAANTLLGVPYEETTDAMKVV